MKKVYYLKTCDTCKRILNELNPSSDFVLQDIKAVVITPEQIEEMKSMAGSYEALFSKRARLYKERDLKVHGWVFDIHSGELIDLKIDFSKILENIMEIYRLE